MRKAAFFISFILIFPGLEARSQTSHYLRCISVNVNADVTLTWEQSAPATDFEAYRIFYAESTNPSSFQEIAYIDNITVNNFVHAGGAAGEMSTLYYIVTDLSGGGSIISDTLRTIYLETTDNGEGEVLLSWNAIHEPFLPSASSSYYVYIEYPTNSWNLLETVMEEEYIYEISVCDDSLSFQVVILDSFGCSSASNINGGRYQDIIKPPMPIIDSVSVDRSDQKVVLGWPPSTARDAMGYLIYRFINNNWIPIDTLWGIDNTFYKDEGVDPCQKSEAYALATLDSCGNKSLGSFLLPQQSILLNEVAYSPCDSTNMLSWSQYINMEPALLGYEIFVGIENGPFQYLGLTDPGQTSFTHTSITPGRQYSYFVRAYNASGFGSTSCIKTVYAFDYGRPSYHYLANVSVENNQYISVKILADTSATIQGVRVYRRDLDIFEEIDYIVFSGEEIISYDDLSVNVNQQSYSYKVGLVDSCGYEILNGNIIPSILLQGQILNIGEIQLEWSPLSGWDGDVEAYEVFRVSEGVIETTPIASLPPTQTEYVDDVSGFSPGINSFDYIVAALESANNSYGLEETSYSNIIQLEGTPRIFMPNAFRPSGINNVFKPVGNFIDQKNYSFQIFDRWGRLIFETNRFDRGWDGNYNGEAMPAGVYVYLLNFQQGDGDLGTRKGTFVLLR